MKIAPSILNCNFTEIGQEIINVTNANADLIHLDIMDGHFVPNISFGPDVVKSIRRTTSLPLDVHLMISEPNEYIKRFYESGANIVTFHIESSSNPFKTIKKIRSFNLFVGIAIKPGTDIAKLIPFVPFVDLILIMTVEPGFGGQKFMKSQIPKINALREIIDSNRFKCLIEVDGGINTDTAALVKNAGVDICVAGTSIFNAENMAEAIKMMK